MNRITDTHFLVLRAEVVSMESGGGGEKWVLIRALVLPWNLFSMAGAAVAFEISDVEHSVGAELRLCSY